LVPYPPVLDYHLPNAEEFALAGAARILDESRVGDSLAAAIATELQPLLEDESVRHRMAENMRELSRPDAAANVTEIICDSITNSAVRIAA
jgi:UDP-N-acetylglucosamine:LPS N-acetylglucosamine transferase